MDKLKKFKWIRFGFLFAVCCFILIGGKVCTVSAGTWIPGTDSVKQEGISKNSLTVRWSAVEGADSYHVYLKDYSREDSQMTYVGNTSGVAYTFSNLKGGAKFDVQIVSVKENEECGSKYVYDFITAPDKLTGLKQDKWWFYANILDVSFDQQTGVFGYQVWLYNDKGKCVEKQTLNYFTRNNTSFKKMKNKVYTVKARSFVTFEGKTYYSDWSQITCLIQARVKSVNVSKNKLSVKWNKVSGASAYNIYVSYKPTSGYKKVATVKSNKTSYTLAKFKKKKISSAKKYYVYVETVSGKGKSKNTSGGLYYWCSDGSDGYVQ